MDRNLVKQIYEEAKKEIEEEGVEDEAVVDGRASLLSDLGNDIDLFIEGKSKELFNDARIRRIIQAVAIYRFSGFDD